MPFVTSRSVSRDSRAPRKTGFLGASQRAYTLSRAVYDRLTLRASPIYNTDTRRGPARAKANEKYASNAACPHNSAAERAQECPRLPRRSQRCVSSYCSRPRRRRRPSSCRGRGPPGPRRRKAAATSWATSRRSVASPPPRHRRDDSIVRAQAVYQTWKDQKDGKASTPAVSDAYDYGYRGRSEYALDMPRPEFKYCPPREMTGVPVEITRACATFSGQMYEVTDSA